VGSRPAKPGGNRRSVDIREAANGLMYIPSTGCQWRATPKDLARRCTVYDHMDRWSWDRWSWDRWNWDGTLEQIHHALYVKRREQASREVSPTAAVIDSQSIKSAEKSGGRIDPPQSPASSGAARIGLIPRG
jgi:transposase